jgi:uncharacterized membrane protein YeaQ/YmgE (transglycosylase-associated protein family)
VRGIIAGFHAGRLMKGGGFGLVGDLVLGLLGALIGAWLLKQSFMSGFKEYLEWIAVAVIGACILVWLLRLIKK